MISNLLHRLAHFIDPSPCRCHVAAYMKAWAVSREASRKAVPQDPEAERQLRERIARSEGAA